jgi:hypothetical protein
MTRDEIIKMAIEAGISRSRSPDLYDIWEVSDTELERFAALVAAAERAELRAEVERLRVVLERITRGTVVAATWVSDEARNALKEPK